MDSIKMSFQLSTVCWFYVCREEETHYTRHSRRLFCGVTLYSLTYFYDHHFQLIQMCSVCCQVMVNYSDKSEEVWSTQHLSTSGATRMIPQIGSWKLGSTTMQSTSEIHVCMPTGATSGFLKILKWWAFDHNLTLTTCSGQMFCFLSSL